MGSSHKPKSVRTKSARPNQRRSARKIGLKTSLRASEVVAEIPLGVQDEIERQRDVLMTIISILHCFHVVLERQSMHRDENMDMEFDLRLQAAARCVSLHQVSALLLERTHAVFAALDIVNLTKPAMVLKP